METSNPDPAPPTTNPRTHPDVNRYRTLKFFLSGRGIKGVVNGKQTNAGSIATETGLNPGTLSKLLREWEQDGVIVGYVPVLSEKGRAYLQALKTMAELKGEAPKEEGGDGDFDRA